MKKIILGVIFSLVMISCSSLMTKEYNGTYTQGSDVNIFKDESTGQVYWLTGDRKALDDLREKMEELREKENNPFPSVKIKIVGKDKGEATNGLAQEGDRFLEVKSYEIEDNY